MSNQDQHFMQLALDLASRGQGHVEPNPLVGCVLVKENIVVGQGFHERFGHAHAEVNALRSLESSDHADGATAYVTLEPCCHHGKTPPCSRALIDAGIRRVVIAMRDPFPKVDGGGVRELREAGIEVEIGVHEQEAEQINSPYLKRVHQAKPWVIAKWAMTIDGRIATTSGQSQWITSPPARGEVHRLRSRVDAVAVGMGTVEADDPMLTARGCEPTPRQAARIVYATKRLPRTDSQLVMTARQIPTIIVLSKSATVASQHIRQLAHAGVELLRTDESNPAKLIDESLLSLGKRGMTNLMVEGGAKLLASFFEADQIDEAHVYIGAKAFGGQSAPGPIGGKGVAEISGAATFSLIHIDPIGDDVRIVYRRN